MSDFALGCLFLAVGAPATALAIWAVYAAASRRERGL